MKKLDIAEIQKIGVDILQYIKTVCYDNGISMFLAYGTVLGAVRHKGFIPWDDDIDIYMFRSDYERFKQIMIRKPEDRYKLLDVQIDPDYNMPLAKVIDTSTSMDWYVAKRPYPLGVWVDIYVLDNVPDDNKELHNFQSRLNFLQNCFFRSFYKGNVNSLRSLLSWILFSWTKLFGPRYFSKRMVLLSQKYNKIGTLRVAPSSFTASSREDAVLDRSIMGKGVELPFEGVNYLVPEHTDAYLKHFYGNYMELPPEEDRISNHTADFFLI